MTQDSPEERTQQTETDSVPAADPLVSAPLAGHCSRGDTGDLSMATQTDSLVSMEVSHANTDTSSPPGRTVLSSTDLSVFYGEERALADVSIEIPEHSVTAIIGPSGCGKSTFLRCINRMNDQIPACRVEGELRFNGTDIYDEAVDPVALRRTIGMVFQKPNPFPKSIYDNVAYGLRVQGQPVTDERVEEALRRAALFEEVEGNLEQSGLELSGGQQQRLCIARAIAPDPEILLMDEPASALDPIATAKIEDLIADLAAEYTVVIVTHNMQQAARISDTTAVFLTGGELAECGPTGEIFEDPADQRVEDYITGKFG